MGVQANTPFGMARVAQHTPRYRRHWHHEPEKGQPSKIVFLTDQCTPRRGGGAQGPGGPGGCGAGGEEAAGAAVTSETNGNLKATRIKAPSRPGPGPIGSGIF
jgi:hypothetical protein